MAAIGRVRVGCDDLGRRVSVRQRDAVGGFSDVIGILETCDDDTFGIRDKAGKMRLVTRREVVAAKVVPPAPRRSRKGRGAGSGRTPPAL